MEHADDGAVLLVHAAGVSWDAVQGTDHRLAEHLRRRLSVLWVDPIRPWRPGLLRRGGVHRGIPGLQQLDERFWRLAVVGPPGSYRPVVREVALTWQNAWLRRTLGVLRHNRVVLLNGNPSFPGWRVPADARVVHVTDDFSAAAQYTGLRPARMERIQRANLAAATTVSAVSPLLVEQLARAHPDARLLPNGCSPEFFDASVTPTPGLAPAHPVAGVVGQFNDRLDYTLLDAIAAAGASLLLVGPRLIRDPATAALFDRLVARPSVTWTDQVPYEDLPAHMAHMDVGLTPYTDTAFNRASFPLKTLEYLSAGLPVVSTDLPAAHWLGHSSVEVASPSAFVAAALARLADPRPDLAEERRAFARRHSWGARADDLHGMLTEALEASGRRSGRR